MAISAVTLAELSAGPHQVRPNNEQDLYDEHEERSRRTEALQRAESEFDPVPFDAEAARIYGRVTAAVGNRAGGGRGPRNQASTDTSQQFGKHARCVPDRTVDLGDSRSLTDNENTSPTCVTALACSCIRCLPSWSCGFDSRHLLPVQPVLSLFCCSSSSDMFHAFRVRSARDLACSKQRNQF
jgi:hypothetical protein